MISSLKCLTNVFVLGVASLATTLGASAQLTFENYRFEVDADPGAETVEVAFDFLNEGETPISITRVETNCGCTVASSPGEAIQTEETSSIQVRFDLGDRRGLQTKRIVLSTDHPRQPRITLTLVVDIPTPVSASPSALIWRNGELRTPKVVSVGVLDHPEVEFLGLGESTEGFTVNLAVIEPQEGESEGTRQELSVTPDATTPAGTYTVPLHYRIGDEEALTHVAIRLLGTAPEAAPDSP